MVSSVAEKATWMGGREDRREGRREVGLRTLEVDMGGGTFWVRKGVRRREAGEDEMRESDREEKTRSVSKKETRRGKREKREEGDATTNLHRQQRRVRYRWEQERR